MTQGINPPDIFKPNRVTQPGRVQQPINYARKKKKEKAQWGSATHHDTCQTTQVKVGFSNQRLRSWMKTRGKRGYATEGGAIGCNGVQQPTGRQRSCMKTRGSGVTQPSADDETIGCNGVQQPTGRIRSRMRTRGSGVTQPVGLCNQRVGSGLE